MPISISYNLQLKFRQMSFLVHRLLLFLTNVEVLWRASSPERSISYLLRPELGLLCISEALPGCSTPHCSLSRACSSGSSYSLYDCSTQIESQASTRRFVNVTALVGVIAAIAAR